MATCERCPSVAAFSLVIESLCSVAFENVCRSCARKQLDAPAGGLASVIRLRGEDWGEELSLSRARAELVS